tara:strand:+ start:1147 stop:3966 length:2820 start_codon:yes stop_codon:yes gene_type:complete
MVVECIIECSRLASNEAKSGNDDNYGLWTNTTGSGLLLNPGDEIQVQSAYINEIGVGSDTIEISDSNNKMDLTLQFFKTGDGENLMQLPRNAIDDTIASNFNSLGETDFSGDTYNYYSNFRECSTPEDDRTTAIVQFGGRRDHNIREPLYNQNYFNQRLTIMTSDLITPITPQYDNSDDFEYCFFEYQIKTQDVNIELPLGHLTPSNICNHVNKAFNKKIGNKIGYNKLIRYQADGTLEQVQGFPEQFNFTNDIPIYNCYQPIQCATYGTFNKGSFNKAMTDPSGIETGINTAGLDPTTKLYYNSFNSIAVYDPESFILGRKFMTNLGNLSSFTIVSQDNFTVPILGNIVCINTTIPWNDDNITNLKNWVHSQYDNNDLFKTMFPNNDRRYIHVDSDVGETIADKFGSDQDFNKMTLAQYIDFDVRQKDNFTNDYDGSLQYNNYGFMVHYSGTNTIGFRLFDGLPNDIITYDYNTASPNCGYDIHYSAFGTNAFLLSNSLSPVSYYIYQGKYTTGAPPVEQSFNTPITTYSLTVNSETSSMINHIYVGAENAGLNFDSISSRFYFENLYTSKKISNTQVSGLNLQQQFKPSQGSDPVVQMYLYTNATDADTASNPNVGQQIYTLNPMCRTIIYNPEFWKPMVNLPNTIEDQKSFFTSFNLEIETYPGAPPEVQKLLLEKPSDGNNKFQPNLNFFNQNIKYDSQSGIWLLFGNSTKKLWLESIWNLIGFSYEGLKLDQLYYDRQIQLNSLNLTSYPLTTNTENNASYLETQNSNPYGEPIFVPWCYNPLASINEQLYNAAPVQTGHNPEINVETQSFHILAQFKPIKQKYPYYTIRSDIILNKNFIGGNSGTNLPVVAIANKAYVSDDYYFMISSSMSFTIDTPTILTSITQSIHNPLGEIASVDQACSVIYMITKNINIQQQIPQQIQQKKPEPPQPRR